MHYCAAVNNTCTADALFTAGQTHIKTVSFCLKNVCSLELT